MLKRLKTNNFWKGRNGYIPLAVVLHITDSTETSAINTLQNPNSSVSTHYLVGEVDNYQLVKDEDASWHCGLVRNPTTTSPALKHGVNPNYTTIGIEVVSTGAFPKISQWLRWAKLVADVCKRNFISISETGIINHNELRSDKRCPGKWFCRQWAIILIKIFHY